MVRGLRLMGGVDSSPVPNDGHFARLFRRILLIKPSSLGDVVHALPVLHGLRCRYPDAEIDWLVSKSCAPLLRGHPEISRLVEFDRSRFARVGTHWRVTVEFGRFLRDLRERRYDLVIDLQGLFRTGFLARATGAPLRIGFADAREGAWAFYNHGIPKVDENTHAVDRNYRVAGFLGFADVPVQFPLGLSASDRAEAEALLKRFGVRPGKNRLVGVVPGARWETKVWPAERFVSVVDNLRRVSGVISLLLGGPDEESLCARIAGACQDSPVNLAGQTNVKELASIIELTDVVLAHDSAAMHLAVAMDRPLVCLTGPTNPHRTGPYRRLEDVERVELECSPCYLRRLSDCRHAHRCMTELDAERVVSQVQRRLGR